MGIYINLKTKEPQISFDFHKHITELVNKNRPGIIWDENLSKSIGVKKDWLIRDPGVNTLFNIH